MLGYYGEGEYYLPLTFTYDVTKTDGTVVEQKTEMSLKSQAALYDGIGVGFNNDSGSSSDYSFKNRLDIFLDDPSDTVDAESIVAYNIYTPTRSQNPDGTYTKYMPDLTTKYYVSKATSYFEEETNYKFDDFGSFHLDTVNYYEGQISFACSYDFTKAAEQMKTNMNADGLGTYDDALADVEKGILGIRYRFYNFTAGSYRLLFKDGTYKEMNVQVANANGASALELSKTTGKLVFMVTSAQDDGTKIRYKDISNFYLEGITLRLEFYVLTTSKSYTSATTLDYYFGAIDTNESLTGFKNHNYNVIFWSYVIIVGLIFTGLAIANYYYRKDKYKNDEFLRVQLRPYLKSAGKFFLACEILMIDFFYIFLRNHAFNNSPVVANPTDKWIIIFSIAGIIVIGFLIKFGITSYKTHKEMKKMDALKVNEDHTDDGTINMEEKKPVKKDKKSLKKEG